MLYALDFFCGAGGMSEGLLQAGFHILFSNDLSTDVQQTYMNRHNQLGLIQDENTHFHCGDISNLNAEYIFDKINNLKFFNEINLAPKQIDAIFGGPPCQGFSRAGKRNSDDPRNLLFREYLRIINEIRPRYVVMENVQGFNDTKFFKFVGTTGKNYEDGLTAPKILLSEFNLIGYNVLTPQVLDASNFGIPQKRKRVIFIAYLKGEQTPKYPTPLYEDNNILTVSDAISDLIVSPNRPNPQLSRYQLDSRKGRTPTLNGMPIEHKGKQFNTELSKHSPLIIERFSLFKEGEDGSHLRKRILEQGIDLSGKNHILDYCSEKLGVDKNSIIDRFKNKDISTDMLDTLLTKKTIRTRLCRDKPSLTVVTLPDDYISPFENRTFSVREMARLQSFDDSFKFLSKRTTGGPRRKVEVPQYTQVGNAVPPLLANAIALEIKKALIE